MCELFVCSRCGCVDIISLSPRIGTDEWLCSLHNPTIGKWHGEFARELYNPNTDIVCNKPTNLGLS